MALLVELKSIGNPDHGENPDQPMWGVENETVAANDLKHAAALCRDWIDENDLGGGNWDGGDILEDGQVVARVSYNGRIWDLDGKAAL